MILVDSSILIGYFKGDESERIDAFHMILKDAIPYNDNDFTTIAAVIPDLKIYT